MYYLFKWEEEEAGAGCDVFLIEFGETNHYDTGYVVKYNKLHEGDWKVGDPYSITVREEDGERLIFQNSDLKKVEEIYYLEIL